MPARSRDRRGRAPRRRGVPAGSPGDADGSCPTSPKEPIAGPARAVAGSDERDRAALAAALDPIVTIDFSGTILSASDSILRVLGWTPAELIGRNVNVLMPEPHRSAHDGYLAAYRQTGRTNILNRPRRFEALRKDGSPVLIELCVSRAEIPGGGEPLFVGIIRDMSAYAQEERTRDEERVRSQQQLAEQTAALQQAHLRLRTADRMASIGTLAAGLGHDMNNVLLPVRAHLNAASAVAQREDVRAHLRKIAAAVEYLQQLADGLHFLAHDPEIEEDARGGGRTTDLRQWWSQVGVLLTKAVPRYVRVVHAFPPELPQVGMAPHAMMQAVLNLVTNAGEAIPPPKDRKRRQGLVRVWAQAVEDANGPWVRLGVTDNGSGMSEEVRRRAFDLFYTTKPRGLGTGLGLPLVRRVAERVGGRVEIESAPGRGTTVVMILPAARLPGGAEGIASPGVVITIADGRAAALVRHVLESSGASIVPEARRADAEVWVTDPAATRLAEITAWRSDDPRRRVVLLGAPDGSQAPAWRRVNPLIIEAVDDFEAVRAALVRAVTSRSGSRAS